MHKFIA